MALFGSLNALPLEKLLQLLAHKEGAVEIWNVKDIPATTLYLKLLDQLLSGVRL